MNGGPDGDLNKKVSVTPPIFLENLSVSGLRNLTHNNQYLKYSFFDALYREIQGLMEIQSQVIYISHLSSSSYSLW